MDNWNENRFSDAELHVLFDRLFPAGFAGPDVRAALAPESWEQSPLQACFHPSIEQLFEEHVRFHRGAAELRRLLNNGDKHAVAAEPPPPEPTIEDVRREYRPHPVDADAELIELVCGGLWDIFSDNHEVIAADGRIADIGSFRGASAFLDEHLSGDAGGQWRVGDHMRFYMGTAFFSGRADLTPVYTMIFRRLQAIGADWMYSFPEIHVVDIGGLREESDEPARSSVSEGAVVELTARKRNDQIERLRADLADSSARAREEAMDQPPPPSISAYREVYGGDPRGWPPA